MKAVFRRERTKKTRRELQSCENSNMGDISEPQREPALRPNVEENKLYTFDDVIRERAEDPEQVPLIAYPKTRDGVSDYEFFTGRELNRLVDGAAKALIGMGVEPVVSPALPLVVFPQVQDEF